MHNETCTFKINETCETVRKRGGSGRRKLATEKIEWRRLLENVNEIKLYYVKAELEFVHFLFTISSS